MQTAPRTDRTTTGTARRPPRLMLSGGFVLLLALGSCSAIEFGDGAATDASSSRTAAAATAGPIRLQNLSGTQVVAMLGEPGFRREENPAQIWRYRSESCVLELMLYRLDRDLQVRHVEARDDKFRAVAQNACIDSIAAAKSRPVLRS